jgi:hypothetical protein
MVKYCFLAILVIVSGCNKNQARSLPTSDPRLASLALSCASSFQESWCGGNLVSTNQISAACIGSSYSGDTIIPSIMLKTSEGNNCLVDSGLAPVTANIAGCAGALQKRYAGPSYITTILQCFDTNGNLIYIDGTSDTGVPFRALKGQ